MLIPILIHVSVPILVIIVILILVHILVPIFIHILVPIFAHILVPIFIHILIRIMVDILVQILVSILGPILVHILVQMTTWVIFSPLTAQLSSSPASIKSAAERLCPMKNLPFPSEIRTSHGSFFHFHQRVTLFTNQFYREFQFTFSWFRRELPSPPPFPATNPLKVVCF